MAVETFRFNRIRPHDADTKRRQFALERAQKLDSVRGAFVDWCRVKGIPEHEIEANLEDLDMLVDVWRDVSTQGKID